MARVFRFDLNDMSSHGSQPNNNQEDENNKFLANMNYVNVIEDSQAYESSPGPESAFDEEGSSRINKSRESQQEYVSEYQSS